MIKNYLVTAWRNIKRHKATSLINILGLSLGVSACLIIYLLASFEFHYDKFHPEGDRIYRVTGQMKDLSGKILRTGCVPCPTGQQLKQEIPGMETVAGFFIYDANVTIENGSQPPKHFTAVKSETDNNIVIAEPTYFDIFQYKWLAGNKAQALAAPFQVVLSRQEARRYFDQLSPDKIIGRQVIYNDSLRLMVSGIVEDWKENSDLDFKDFISWATIDKSFLKNTVSLTKWSNWDINNQVFVKLSKKITPAGVSGQLASFSKTYLRPSDWKPALHLQPLKDLHFDTAIGDEYSRKASLPALYGLIGIAAFILILAAINFINLSTAQSTERAKEIGIRKVLGSSRHKLVFQFLGETFLLTLMSVLVALLSINPLLQLFHAYIPPGLHFQWNDPGVLLFLSILTTATSLLAGLYPAWLLSGSGPVSVLKGQSSGVTRSHGWLRQGLIVFQFTISLLFIIGTLVIGQQIHFMLNKDLGYTKDAIVTIRTANELPAATREVFAQRIKTLPHVSMVSLSAMPAAASMQNGTVMVYKGKEKVEVETADIMADENFVPLYGIKLVAGHNYPHSDTINQLLVNETAARRLGFQQPADAIGKMVFIGMSDRPNSNQEFPITGVVSDFYLESLHVPIRPLFLAPSQSFSKVVNIKLSSTGGFSSTLASIGEIWKQLYPEQAFEYQFLDESIAAFYEKEQKTAHIVNVAMGVAILISCLGLIGLVTFTTARRRKEIGVRKVLGASVQRIMVMICKDFVLLVLLAILIASPVAWWLMHRWLEDFPYRVSIGGWVFIAAGLSAVVITLMSVSIQTVRAATANPVKSLRTE